MWKYTLLLLILPLLASAEGVWKEKLSPLLPPKVQKIKVAKTTLQEAQDFLGKANLIEGNKQYYIIDEFKYALEVSYENGIVKSFHYTFPKKRPRISSLKIDPKLFKQESDKFLKFKDENGELTVDIMTQTLYSVKVLK